MIFAFCPIKITSLGNCINFLIGQQIWADEEGKWSRAGTGGVGGLPRCPATASRHIADTRRTAGLLANRRGALPGRSVCGRVRLGESVLQFPAQFADGCCQIAFETRVGQRALILILRQEPLHLVSECLSGNDVRRPLDQRIQ